MSITINVKREEVIPSELSFSEEISYEEKGNFFFINVSDYEDFLMMSDKDFQEGFEEAHKEIGKPLDEINWVD